MKKKNLSNKHLLKVNLYCSIGPRNFWSKSKLYIHFALRPTIISIRAPNPKYLFKASFGGHEFRFNMNGRRRVNVTSLNWRCAKCSRPYKSNQTLRRHIRDEHGGDMSLILPRAPERVQPIAPIDEAVTARYRRNRREATQVQAILIIKELLLREREIVKYFKKSRMEWVRLSMTAPQPPIIENGARHLTDEFKKLYYEFIDETELELAASDARAISAIKHSSKRVHENQIFYGEPTSMLARFEARANGGNDVEYYSSYESDSDEEARLNNHDDGGGGGDDDDAPSNE